MKKSRRWPKILGIIVVLIGIFVFTAPASLIKNQVQEANLPVQLSGYQGRLFNGQVQSVFINGISYENLSWRINPLDVLSGDLSAELTLEDAQANLSIDLGFRSQEDWQFHDLNGRLGLAKLTKLSRILAFVKPQGQLAFDGMSSSLYNAKFSNTDGTLEWQNASLTLNGRKLPLGLITGEISDDGDHFYLDFSGQEGIQPSGQIKLTPAGNYELEILLDPGYLPNGFNWMNNMGKVNPDGRLGLSLKGRI